MSKVTVGILFVAIGLILLATYFKVLFVAGGSAIVLVVALAYSYVVAKRDEEALESGGGAPTAE